jgi:hypothetical protein
VQWAQSEGHQENHSTTASAECTTDCGGSASNNQTEECALLCLLLVIRLDAAGYQHILFPMLSLDVADLVAEHVGQLCFVVYQREQAGGDVDRAC